MTSFHSPANTTNLESKFVESVGDTVEYKVHSKLVSSPHLMRVLQSQLPTDSFTIEMRHSIYMIRVKKNCIPAGSTVFKGVASGT